MPVRRRQLRTVSRIKRRGMRRARMGRGLRSASPVFTETYRSPTPLLSNAGNIFNVTANAIPEWADYANLYNAYRVLRVQVLIIPNHNVGQVFDSTTAGGQSSVMRIAYAINDSTSFPPPGSEVDVLSDNGSRVKLLDKPLRITHRPVAQLAMTDVNAPGVVAAVTQKRTWLNTNATGAAVVHAGVNYWTTSAVTGLLPTAAYYYRVTFQLKDPK